ncbi:hypothetical protein ACFFMS_11270 [Ectobacillus funiculus]|uniref:Uncharacterized protein n=2 Tax=Ectobacillus funiculus TaxID=137993 RepID=A0ABV5WEQ1_9BACI
MVVIGIIGVIVSVALLLRAIFKSSAKATKQPIHSDETEKLLESTGTPQQAAIVEATRTLEETRILEETVHLHSAVKNEHVVETTLLATDKEKKQSIEIPTILLLDEEKEQQTQSNFNKNNSDEENSVAATVLLKAKEQEM